MAKASHEDWVGQDGSGAEPVKAEGCMQRDVAPDLEHRQGSGDECPPHGVCCRKRVKGGARVHDCAPEGADELLGRRGQAGLVAVALP